MPRTCNIKGCKKTAKLLCENTTPPTYLCLLNDEVHDQQREGLIFTKLVNCPCITCVNLNQEHIKEATFGPVIEGKLKRMYCKVHSSTDGNMVGKKAIRRCQYTGCEIQPSFCMPGETARKFCNKHKPNNAVHSTTATGKLCTHTFDDNTKCMTQPTYGFIDDRRPTYCKEHRLQGMQNIYNRNRGCEVKNCPVIRATFGFASDKKPSRCAAHRTNQMIDIINPKCVGCGLFVVTAQKNYRCAYCTEGTAYKRTNERCVLKILEENFTEYPFSSNCVFPQDTTCALAKYRPDFTFDRGSYYVIIECDEDAHSQYDITCERKRMYEITGGLGLPVIFVRYNPDSPCDRETKKRQLVSTVEKYLTTNSEDLFQRSTIIVHYLFYDATNETSERIIGLEEINGELTEIDV